MTTLAPFHIDNATFLREHCTLPALPQAVTQIQSILNSDNISVSRVAGLISKDPSLVAQVLKIVNSAYYSLPREISDVNLAVGFLGINETYRIVLSISVVNSIGNDDRAALSAIWDHSVYTALSAKYLKQSYEPLMSHGELWAAAILHDIGKLVYIKFFPEHFQVILDTISKTGCLFHEAEKSLGYTPSAELGALLSDHWRLPQKVKFTCKYHDLIFLNKLDAENPDHAFPRIVSIANMMTLLATNGLSKEKKESIKETICKILKIDETEFLVHMGAIYDLKDEVAKMRL
ncbi:HDOD domain-containing protein [bacterium]|nr:HDOD domain-containing protein [bacterium]